MATTYFLKDENSVVYHLSAIESFVVGKTSTASSYRIQTGKEVSDNIVVNGRTVEMKGRVSDITLPFYGNENQQRGVPTEVFLVNLDSKINAKQLFTFYFSDGIPSIQNCLISNFVYEKNNQLGGASYDVSFSLRQLRFGEGARVVKEPQLEFKDLLAEKEKSSQNKSDLDGNQQAQLNNGLLSGERGLLGQGG